MKIPSPFHSICKSCFTPSYKPNSVGLKCTCQKGTLVHPSAVNINEVILKLLHDKAEMSEQINNLNHQVAVLFDAILSRLPETALQPLKQGQISALSKLVNDRVQSLLYNPCKEVILGNHTLNDGNIGESYDAYLEDLYDRRLESPTIEDDTAKTPSK